MARMMKYRYIIHHTSEMAKPEAIKQRSARWWEWFTKFKLWVDHSHADNATRVTKHKLLDTAYKLRELIDEYEENKDHHKITVEDLYRTGVGKEIKRSVPHWDEARPEESTASDAGKEFDSVYKAIKDGSMYNENNKGNAPQRPGGNSTLFYNKDQPPPSLHHKGREADITHAWEDKKQQNNRGKGNNNNNNNNNNK